MPELDLLITDLARELLLVALMIAAPMLLAGLIVGLGILGFGFSVYAMAASLSGAPGGASQEAWERVAIYSLAGTTISSAWIIPSFQLYPRTTPLMAIWMR